MNAVILCDGDPPSRDLLLRHLQFAPLIVCTDGALDWVRTLGVCPHVVVGDMDSCQSLPECEVVDCGPHGEQENSDSEKALLLALERGASRIVFLGATGQRLDHTLANIWLAARYHDRAEVVLGDDYGELRVISGRQAFATHPGTPVSLLPMGPGVTVSTTGLRWPLHEPLEIGTRGLSNEAIGDEVVIEADGGLVAVVLLAEPAPASAGGRP